MEVVEVDNSRVAPVFKAIEKLLATPGVQLVIYMVLKGEPALDIH